MVETKQFAATAMPVIAGNKMIWCVILWRGRTHFLKNGYDCVKSIEKEKPLIALCGRKLRAGDIKPVQLKELKFWRWKSQSCKQCYSSKELVKNANKNS